MMIKLENRSKEITEGNLISKEHMNTLPVKTNTNFFANLLKKLYKIIFKPISEFINFKN